MRMNVVQVRQYWSAFFSREASEKVPAHGQDRADAARAGDNTQLFLRVWR